MAFDWIESHRGLKDHPKTVALAAAWSDRKPCVLGHLHELWWWTLEYAPDGVIRSAFFPQVVSACEWHGRPHRFWNGLVEGGFLEAPSGLDGYLVHDWDEYAYRRVERHEKESARKRAWREQAGRAGRMEVDAPAGRPEEPAGRAAGASPTRARHRTTPDQPEYVAAAAVAPGPDLAHERARGDGGLQHLGVFLNGNQRRRQRQSPESASLDDDVPAEVLERLNQPPIGGAA